MFSLDVKIQSRGGGKASPIGNPAVFAGEAKDLASSLKGAPGSYNPLPFNIGKSPKKTSPKKQSPNKRSPGKGSVQKMEALDGNAGGNGGGRGLGDADEGDKPEAEEEAPAIDAVAAANSAA
jgi:hypothetical protein